jgi:hypothetical protein
VFQPVGFGADDDDGKGQLADFVLLRQTFVHRQKQIELAGSGDQLGSLPLLMLAQPACGTVLT